MVLKELFSRVIKSVIILNLQYLWCMNMTRRVLKHSGIATYYIFCFWTNNFLCGIKMFNFRYIKALIFYYIKILLLCVVENMIFVTLKTHLLQHYFLICKIKWKWSYWFTPDYRGEKQIDFDWTCLLGKLQNYKSQLVCTPRSRCKIRCSIKQFVLTTFSGIIRLVSIM